MTTLPPTIPFSTENNRLTTNTFKQLNIFVVTSISGAAIILLVYYLPTNQPPLIAYVQEFFISLGLCAFLFVKFISTCAFVLLTQAYDFGRHTGNCDATLDPYYNKIIFEIFVVWIVGFMCLWFALFPLVGMFTNTFAKIVYVVTVVSLVLVTFDLYRRYQFEKTGKKSETHKE